MQNKHVVLAALAAIFAAKTGTAQSKSHAYVVVTARDSSGVPVSGAELVVRRGLRDVLAQGATDENGRGFLAVETSDSTDLQVTMRKIGYGRGDRFFMIGPKDT